MHIIGYARTKMDDSKFLEQITSKIKAPASSDDKQEKEEKSFEDQLNEFKKLCSYQSGPYDEDQGFEALEEKLKEKESMCQPNESNKETYHRVFYLALPPSVFTTVAAKIKKNCYTSKGINRLIVEKPFGKDLKSSRELMAALSKDWKEDEIFRIDHYLGKGTSGIMIHKRMLKD